MMSWGPQSRTQSNACARARMELALGKLTTGTPKFRGSGFVGMHVKPITAQEKFNFPRANAILARAQALLWVRDCGAPREDFPRAPRILSAALVAISFHVA